MQMTLGQVVISKAGRDVGRRFVVVGLVDEIYVLLADGSLRRIEKPKKKKIKHLKQTEEVIEGLTERLESKQKVSNSEFQKALGVQSESQDKTE